MQKELLRQWKTDEQKTEYVRRYEEIQKFQDYLGPMGYQLIGVEATRGGVIFKGDKYEDEAKIIAPVKSVYGDEQNQEKEVLRYQLEVKPMVITEEQEADFQAATHCYMCDKSNYKESRRSTLSCIH